MRFRLAEAPLDTRIFLWALLESERPGATAASALTAAVLRQLRLLWPGAHRNPVRRKSYAAVGRLPQIHSVTCTVEEPHEKSFALCPFDRRDQVTIPTHEHYVSDISPQSVCRDVESEHEIDSLLNEDRLSLMVGPAGTEDPFPHLELRK